MPVASAFGARRAEISPFHPRSALAAMLPSIGVVARLLRRMRAAVLVTWPLLCGGSMTLRRRVVLATQQTHNDSVLVLALSIDKQRRHRASFPFPFFRAVLTLSTNSTSPTALIIVSLSSRRRLSLFKSRDGASLSQTPICSICFNNIVSASKSRVTAQCLDLLRRSRCCGRCCWRCWRRGSSCCATRRRTSSSCWCDRGGVCVLECSREEIDERLLFFQTPKSRRHSARWRQ